MPKLRAVEDVDGLLVQLATVIAGDPELVLPGWAHLALVSVVDAGTPDMTGFCYRPGQPPRSVAPSDFALFDVLEALREAMARRDGARVGAATGRAWVSCLLRIEQATGALGADFEYDDPARWAVTGANRERRAAELAP